MIQHFPRVFAVLVVAGVSTLTSLLSLGLLVAERRGLIVRSRFSIWSGRAATAIVALGVLSFAFGLLIEADWLEVTHVTVKTGKWPRGKRLRVAHVSDFHVDRASRALNQLAVEIRDEPVDLLVFTGDAINEREATKLFRTTLGGLPARLGRVAVRGNHDVTRWKNVDLFGGGVATELTDRGPLILEDGTLAVCGAAFNDYDALPDCIAGAPKGAFVILAFHTPDLVEAMDPAPDLYLAGHTHGGQIALPFYGALVTLSRFDKKYESGVFHVGPTTLVVNRGIGFEAHLPRVRFFSRPELTVIDVEGDGPKVGP